MNLVCRINVAEKQKKIFSFIYIYKFIINEPSVSYKSSRKAEKKFHLYKFMNKWVSYKSGKKPNDKVYINDDRNA